MKEKEELKEEVPAQEESMKSSFKKKLAKKDEEIEKIKADMEHWKNEYYKAFADMANLRKEIERDHKEVIKYRVEGFADQLTSVLDAFDMAFKVEPKNDETKNYLQGFKYVFTQLISILESEGIQVISPNIGSKFDEKTMNCVQVIEDEGEENIVKALHMKGYKLHDHLIRPAMVEVSKHPEIKKEDDIKEESSEEKEEDATKVA